MRQDQRALGDLLREEPVGVAAPVPALVVVADPAGLAGASTASTTSAPRAAWRLHDLVVVGRQRARRHGGSPAGCTPCRCRAPGRPRAAPRQRRRDQPSSRARAAGQVGDALRVALGGRLERVDRAGRPPQAHDPVPAREAARGAVGRRRGEPVDHLPPMTAGGRRTSDLSPEISFPRLVRHLPDDPPLPTSMTPPRTRSRWRSPPPRAPVAVRRARSPRRSRSRPAPRRADARLHVERRGELPSSSPAGRSRCAAPSAPPASRAPRWESASERMRRRARPARRRCG